jgi:hypothetical protein
LPWPPRRLGVCWRNIPQRLFENKTTMLDIHPPEHTPHTWRDFFIHIGTIILGLCIAIGLEQSVEYIHHRRQLADTRAALLQEREQDRKNFAVNTAEFRKAAAFFQNDLLVLRYLQQHPGTPEEKLPGVLVYAIRYEPMIQSEWETAKQTGVTEWIPRAEVARNDELYDLASRINNGAFAIFQECNLARQYGLLDQDLSHLTPLQINKQISLTQDNITALFEWGAMLDTLGHEFPDFTAMPTGKELHALAGLIRSPQDTQRLLPAQQQTDARTKGLDDAVQAADKVAQTK